jgi:hypothetical protein
MVVRFEGSTAVAFVELVAFVAFAGLLSIGKNVPMGVVVIVVTEPPTPGAGVVLFAWTGRPAPCPSRQDPAWHGNVSVPFCSRHVADTFASGIPAVSASSGNSHTRLGQMDQGYGLG